MMITHSIVGTRGITTFAEHPLRKLDSPAISRDQIIIKMDEPFLQRLTIPIRFLPVKLHHRDSKPVTLSFGKPHMIAPNWLLLPPSDESGTAHNVLSGKRSRPLTNLRRNANKVPQQALHTST